MDVTSWLLFTSVLVNQMGRVLIPAIKTTVIADPEMGSEFKDKVGMFLSGVSIVCLGGKLLGAAVTDKLGGWLILIAVFAIWIVATGGAVVAQSVDIFGYAWLLNSFAYTITWGAVLQVIGATYTNDSEKTAQLTFASSASRFGATIGNIVYGQLLTAGFGWRQVCMPMIPLQALLLLLVIYKWNSATPAAAPKPATPKAGEAPAPPKLRRTTTLIGLRARPLAIGPTSENAQLQHRVYHRARRRDGCRGDAAARELRAAARRRSGFGCPPISHRAVLGRGCGRAIAPWAAQGCAPSEPGPERRLRLVRGRFAARQAERRSAGAGDAPQQPLTEPHRRDC